MQEGPDWAYRLWVGDIPLPGAKMLTAVPSVWEVRLGMPFPFFLNLSAPSKHYHRVFYHQNTQGNLVHVDMGRGRRKSVYGDMGDLETLRGTEEVTDLVSARSATKTVS